jgi:hypothetical protein
MRMLLLLVTALALAGCPDEMPPTPAQRLQTAMSLYPDHDVTVVDSDTDLEKRSAEGWFVLKVYSDCTVMWRPKK